MSDAKPVSPARRSLQASKAQTLMTGDEKTLMSEVPYASVVGSLVYAIVYIRPDIAQAI